jgi:methionine-rich copper-binding protein CopC
MIQHSPRYRMEVRALVTLLGILAATVVPAHGKLAASVPAEGSRLATAPTQVVLRFNEPMRLTAVSITDAQGARQAIAPLPAEVQREIGLPLPVQSAGKRELHWRGMGPDGHVVAGVLHFEVIAAPDHAARR